MTRRASAVGAKPDDLGVDSGNNAYRGAGRKKCGCCGVDYLSYSKTRKFCSHRCYNLAATVRFERPCQYCGALFKPNTKRSKFCSRTCLSGAKPKTAGYIPRPRPVYLVKCLHCVVEFRVGQKSKRKFCGYPCFIASGGPLRAGEAAAMAKSKYGAKKDANHTEVFEAIRSLTAAHDLSNVGCGCPDGVAWVKDGWQLFDVKNPKTAYGRRGLNPRQKKWIADWRGGPVYLLYSVDDALKFARGDIAGLAAELPGMEALDAIGVPFRGPIS